MQPWMMTPQPGQRLLRFVGDTVTFTIQPAGQQPLPAGWRAYLRTNLGRANLARKEIIHAHTGLLPLRNASWHDIPMPAVKLGCARSICLSEPGQFRAKAYMVDPNGRQYWPDGSDAEVVVHPNAYRSANTIYCAFVRMFGATRSQLLTQGGPLDAMLAALDKEGYTTVPPSGKLRDLIRQLPHIMDTLGCRIIHLLPITPTPTTFARFGRFGSPYAVQDFTMIDPALVEFDKQTTGIDQFRELTYAVHLKGGRVFLDFVANHTGWGSTLQENHPEWFLRDPKGHFVSPGAWGVTWEDLVELDHRNAGLWEYLAEVFLIWCRRGVDGFRCDAGYKIPTLAWQYITARVTDQFPETIFLLEGLGGPLQSTENLLVEGGMHWAYSELFQNYSGREVAAYLDYSLKQSERVGLYVHYSETHDNERLAAKGRPWSLLRNRLCALSSVSGGFGFSCGVEWLAPEKINVHSIRGLAWNNPDNIVRELARLNGLLTEHPCFLDGASLVRQSSLESSIYALSRTSAEGLDHVLVLVNTDPAEAHSFALNEELYRSLGTPRIDLLTGHTVEYATAGEELRYTLPPGACHCLAAHLTPRGLAGEAYRRARAQAAWALASLSQVLPAEHIGSHDWRALANMVEEDPISFLGRLAYLEPDRAEGDLVAELRALAQREFYPQVVCWTPVDARRVTLVPPGHWLLIRDQTPFRVSLSDRESVVHAQSIITGHAHIAAFRPGAVTGDATLSLERYAPEEPLRLEAAMRYLHPVPDLSPLEFRRTNTLAPMISSQPGLALLTNGRGGMARIPVDLPTVQSKYDCVLAANLHPSFPVDRHIFVHRLRIWLVADGFISELNRESLVGFVPGPPACWRFVANAGNGRAVEIELLADMLQGSNTTVLRLRRPQHAPAFGRDLPAKAKVNLTLRLDLVDRNFHWETHRNADSETHFTTHCHPLPGEIGFAFTPAPDRRLRVTADIGVYHPEGEWSVGIPHPLELSRGQIAHEDAFSPGWFDLPMARNGTATIWLDAEPSDKPQNPSRWAEDRQLQIETACRRADLDSTDAFARQLTIALQAFLARRDHATTVVAGFPWFLDWGRDALIAARGLLAAGLTTEATGLLTGFGSLEENGTLPNSLRGQDLSNRDTSDAPLWYALVCEEAALAARAGQGSGVYELAVDSKRTIQDVLADIAINYVRGTPNGIRMDPNSGLIWSPVHFTWMDTNYPACTPRAGYPVEIQALWIRLLRQLARLSLPSAGESWQDLANRAERSFRDLFWLSQPGYLADTLIASHSQSAAESEPDRALRSNQLLAVALDLVERPRAQQVVTAAAQWLLVPGALRSLAPLPVSPPIPIHGAAGQLLNDPLNPYFGRYEGDEDTRRKPAYHNGTAWTWSLPIFCEALARGWNFSPESVLAAKAYLGSVDRLMTEGCLGHIPEIVDGDAPHQARGCDAQAWAVSEALRVWTLLKTPVVARQDAV